jgi:hypothetical protein
MSRADFPAFEHLLGPDYGQWGLEEDKSGRFKAYGPKAYFTAGKRINKGIPRNRFQQMRDAKAEQLKKEGVEFTDLYLDNYIATINTVTYVQFKGLHHVQQGATFGDSQDRRTACPEKISVGLFDIDGRWHPENAQPADCKKSHAS